MAYDVNRTNGTALTTVLDGTVNDAKTDIKLFGRGIVNYGEIMAENQVQMLENFANSEPPLKPLLGQLFFNTLDNSLNVLIDEDPQTFSKLLTASGTTSAVIQAETLAKAWVKFDVTGGILGSFGVASVDDQLGGNDGRWRINWTTNFTTENYVVQPSYISGSGIALIPHFTDQLVGSIELNYRDVANVLSQAGISEIMIIAHGEQ